VHGISVYHVLGLIRSETDNRIVPLLACACNGRTLCDRKRATIPVAYRESVKTSIRPVGSGRMRLPLHSVSRR